MDLTVLPLLWATNWFAAWNQAGAFAWGLLAPDLGGPFALSGESGYRARQSHLATLELTADASPQEIRAAWCRLVKLRHPDRRGKADSFQSVHEAYRALGSPGVPGAIAASAAV